MDVTIRTRNFNLTGDQESQIRKRIDRLPRHLDNLEHSELLLTMEPTHSNASRFQFVTQITLRTRNNNVIRSEVKNADLLSAVDDAVGRLSRQIERFKGRFYRNKKGKMGVGKSSADLLAASMHEDGADGSAVASYSVAPVAEDDLGDIVRTKRFAIKPMYPDEAIEQMELLGHNFYVFYNAGENNLNVLYRRTDGNYGLLQPEMN